MPGSISLAGSCGGYDDRRLSYGLAEVTSLRGPRSPNQKGAAVAYACDPGDHQTHVVARHHAEPETSQTQGANTRGTPTRPLKSTADLIALQTTCGNRAVQRLLFGSSTMHAGKGPGSSVLQRQVPPVVPAAGLALTAAGFVATNRPAGTDAFGNNNVSIRYARDQSGPKVVDEVRRAIFVLDTRKSFGDSFAKLALTLRYDGHNIISAYTEPLVVSGYDGGTFGSEAAVNFSAVQQSQPAEPVTAAYLLVQGFNNPSGPGFQRFRARILVTGAGEIEPIECVLTEGEGIARKGGWPPYFLVGFDDRPPPG